MARSKHRRHTSGAAAASSAQKPAAAKPDPSGLPFRSYLLFNAIFSGFCVVQLIIVRLLLSDFSGLYFFFLFLMISFLIVSLFDYFSNRIGIGAQLDDNIESIHEPQSP